MSEKWKNFTAEDAEDAEKRPRIEGKGTSGRGKIADY
jgi:hypothetical protein